MDTVIQILAFIGSSAIAFGWLYFFHHLGQVMFKDAEEVRGERRVERSRKMRFWAKVLILIAIIGGFLIWIRLITISGHGYYSTQWMYEDYQPEPYY